MRRPPLTDALLPLGLVALAQGTVWTGDVSGPRALVALIALTMTAPLAWRRAYPLAVFGVVLASVVALGAVDSSLDDLYTLLAPLVAIESVGAHVALRPAVAALALTLVVLWIGLATETRHHETGDYGFVLFLYGGAWALGRALRSRGERAELDARAAVSAERARIARELHDVVAHSVSVMVVQTSVVRRRIATERAVDAELLAEVEGTGRQAIAEMRRLLRVLRSEHDDLALAPQPGLEHLEPLVASVRDAGLPVEVRVEGAPEPLPAGLDLAAYRIVQEALTNALKHAGPARATVAVRYGPRLELEISDDGRGGAPRGDGTGHGLVGMRERAALYGGSIEAGPVNGGFRVRAVLPVGEA